ncbi:hypothetical protein MXD61_04685 [Frankia sp. AgPm24]|uniref:hypothetical protein n=1 Tax=Frankia sp. AgPm24 TaxID=631128 RepID=UPI00200C408B|nr:hypothetical protein [Frankia sp. AgPm24]MCK9921204.1 hypothetical protein [Frankia sp. AgPm24]
MNGRVRPALDGLRSSALLGLQVGADWSVHCHTYPHRSPILTLRLGMMGMTISPALNAVTSDQIEFAYALIGAANDYLVECERIRFASDDAADPAELRAA